jgi:nickel superoxide dismutase
MAITFLGEKKMWKKIIKKQKVFVALALIVLLSTIVYSHCQVPCGIYSDPARFDMIAEHITTIEKSMRQITELSEQDKPNMNQIVRWVNNKEIHADELAHIVTYYFMAQRIKPVEKAETQAYQQYIKKLSLLHEMLVCSMKAKQTTDLANVEKLKTLLDEFRSAYSHLHDTDN